MAFATWKTPEVEQDGVKYSIVILPGAGTRLRITGKGVIPGADQHRPWEEFNYLLDDIWIDEGITGIGEKAFAQEKNLKKIWLPETITSIGEGAFEGCPNVEVIEYSSTLENLKKIEGAEAAIPEWFDLEEEENGL